MTTSYAMSHWRGVLAVNPLAEREIVDIDVCDETRTIPSIGTRHKHETA